MFSQERERFDSQQLGRAPARQAVFRSCNGFVIQQAFIQCGQALAKQRVAQRIPKQGRGYFRSTAMLRQGKLETASPELPEVQRMPTRLLEEHGHEAPGLRHVASPHRDDTHVA